MKLVLDGCNNPGLSYTSKYKEDIILIYDFLTNDCQENTYEYSKIQDMICDKTSIGKSEIRMVIPLMLKVGILSKENTKMGGKRLRKLNVNNSLFTFEGKCFVQFLKIEKYFNDFNYEQKEIIKDIFNKFGLIQYRELKNSENYIYNDLVVFLQKYKTIDKYEFFLLTNCRKNNQMNLLDDYIKKYRNDEIEDIEIQKDPNAFQYITKLMLQLGILEENTEGKLILGNLIKIYLKEIDNEFK